MDSSRYKRRETQTQRQNYTDIRRPVMARRVIDGVVAAPVQEQRITPLAVVQQPAPAPSVAPERRLPRIDMGLPGDESPRPGTLVVIKSKWATLGSNGRRRGWLLHDC